MEYIITNLKDDIPFESCEDETSRVVRNAKNLLMTHMGEVPYDRLRGFDMSLYGLPMDQFRAELPKEIDRILIWEPRATLVSAEADMMNLSEDKTAHTDVLITVVIDVKIPE